MKPLSALLLSFLMIACGSPSQDTEGVDPSDEKEKGSEKASEEGESDQGKNKSLYQSNCGSCHQADGSGVPGMYPPLRGTERVQGDPDSLIRIVLEGMEGPIQVKGERYDRNMPAQDHLEDEEVARILSYIRRNMGNDAGRIKASRVKKLREKGSE